MKNPEILKLVPDHLKTKKMSKHAVKKLPYLWRYDPDQSKSVPYCYKNHEMSNKAVENCPHALEFVLECYMTQKIV